MGSDLDGQSLGRYFIIIILLYSLFYSFHIFLLQMPKISYSYTCSAENAEKDDIYQLGMILLEVITGKRVNSERELGELKLQVFKFYPYFHNSIVFI